MQAEPALRREAKAEAASVIEGAWPQVSTDQLLRVSETWNCAGIHPGKSKAAVRQVFRGFIGNFQGVTPGRKVRLPGKLQGCVLSQCG